MRALALGFLFALGWFSVEAQTRSSRFAVIGDFGTDDANELAVAQLVKTNLQPDFIVTLGDNQYDGATAYDRDVGKYYHAYIGNYTGTYGAGSATNRFWPSLGNHDYQSDDYAGYTDFFTLPGNERYYDVVLGQVHFFMCNSDSNEPDGTSVGSAQAHWLSNQLVHSTAPWKVIVLHHPPYSSAGSTAGLQWPFRAWGADMVMAGHVHSYERLDVSGFPYIVNGSGGAALEGPLSPISESRFYYNADHGALLANATDARLEVSFYSVSDGGTLIDTLTLTNQSLPQLAIRRISSETNQISWNTNFKAFVLESTTNLRPGATWTQVSQSPAMQGTNYTLRVRATASASYYRLRATQTP